MINLQDHIDKTVLLKLDGSGAMQAQHLAHTDEPTAKLDHRADVEGFERFNGEDRNFYRIPGARWTFCLAVKS